ncbi:MAG: WYL domain-containing protein [Nitrospirae bacterium]|nr:WYL domain-containing protein [Nitrospirota bacterium]
MGIKNIYERFIWFDDRVRRKKYPNTTSLAHEFEISVKTAQRDIEFMRDRLNCPLIYDESLKGYHYEDETFSLPLMYLSSAELSSLVVARKLLQDISGSYIADEITTAVDKITSIIKKHAVSPDSMDDVMSFHLIEYSPAPEDIFRTVLEACLKKKRLSFNYSSPARKEDTTRCIDPYHLFNYMGAWHLIGYCHLRKNMRDFKLNRIRTPQMLDEGFSIPRDFSAKHYFQSSFGIYKGKDKKQVVLRFTPDTAKWISDQIWHREQQTKTLKDGSLELSFPVADFSEIAREILKYGSGVEVLKPEVLRQFIKAEIDKAAKIY